MGLLSKSAALPQALALAAIALLVAGCGEKRPARVAVPPAPSIPASSAGASASTAAASGSTVDDSNPSAAVEPSVPANAQSLFTQTGTASWYGPDYHKRKAANGEIYDMHRLTAAHLTLPLNSIARVTNVATGESVRVRITDRGPFVADRIIDLSMEAAKRISLYRQGVAKVKVEVLQSPASIGQGGRWAVQIGAFGDEDTATQMKDKLERRYHTAKVLDFKGPRHDWWVRVRVLNDDKKRAQELAQENTTPEGGIFLVRID
ncbi:MAG: septal ring lytic transglycosylase RlpA family lipoprotein [Acidobacteria bacterium]|nr:MAG: septal ring lytic transglycosylase RlpA family lipoprotein [Acidobacteriota bacterium]